MIVQDELGLDVEEFTDGFWQDVPVYSDLEIILTTLGRLFGLEMRSLLQRIGQFGGPARSGAVSSRCTGQHKGFVGRIRDYHDNGLKYKYPNRNA